MRRYIIKRLLTTAVVIIAVAVVIFTILYFTPGEPASILLGWNPLYSIEGAVRLRQRAREAKGNEIVKEC